jgi:hypothetical protein
MAHKLQLRGIGCNLHIHAVSYSTCTVPRTLHGTLLDTACAAPHSGKRAIESCDACNVLYCCPVVYLGYYSNSISELTAGMPIMMPMPTAGWTFIDWTLPPSKPPCRPLRTPVRSKPSCLEPFHWKHGLSRFKGGRHAARAARNLGSKPPMADARHAQRGDGSSRFHHRDCAPRLSFAAAVAHARLRLTGVRKDKSVFGGL